MQPSILLKNNYEVLAIEPDFFLEEEYEVPWLHPLDWISCSINQTCSGTTTVGNIPSNFSGWDPNLILYTFSTEDG